MPFPVAPKNDLPLIPRIMNAFNEINNIEFVSGAYLGVEDEWSHGTEKGKTSEDVQRILEEQGKIGFIVRFRNDYFDGGSTPASGGNTMWGSIDKAGKADFRIIMNEDSDLQGPGYKTSIGVSSLPNWIRTNIPKVMEREEELFQRDDEDDE